jgi:hypothetical protein
MEADVLVDTIAAALYRGDRPYAIELAEDYSKACEERGYDAAHNDIRKAIDDLAEYEGEHQVWFHTKDGLRVLGRIAFSNGWPREWKRPCCTRPSLAVDDVSACLKAVDVRTYHFMSRAQDGKPVYVEL